MKNLIINLILMILSSPILFAQSNSDIDPNAITNPLATTFTDDLFDHQFDFICGDASGEAGIETNGDYIYTSKWNGDGFFCYEMDGTFLGAFPVPGESAVRDLAYDGTYFYGAAANTALYEMDFVGQSGTLISTLNAPIETRAIAYDSYYEAFYANNWSTPITLYDRSGNILNQFDCGVHESYYGFAYIHFDGDGPWLYGFAQSGGASQTVIVQIDPLTGSETGVTFDAIGYSSTGTGIAGGLAAFDTYAPGWWTLLGIIQNETIFGIEGGIAGSCFYFDLKLTSIVEPNSGFALGIENIVIGVKSFGSFPQSNFEVRYKVNGTEWVTETVPGPITFGETIEYTFNTPYNFSEFGEYFIEAEVILEGDENPDNNSKEKTIENFDPSNMCEYSITMWDDYGDGWNGGYVQIFGDGVEFINATLASGGGPETIEFLVEDEAFLTAVWTAGGWPYECSYEIFDVNGNSIFQDGFWGVEPTGGDIGYASCWIPDFDAGVTNIISPQSGMLLGIEPVIIDVKNSGAQTLSGIPVGFNLDCAGWINEIIPGPIGSGEEVEYTFSATVDLTELGTYFIEICTLVPDDEFPLNDCQDIFIQNINCYYDYASTNTENEYIANVLMGDIDNSSEWQGEIADYTNLYTVVNFGIPQEIVVTNGNPNPLDYVTVWVDWNLDCVFEQGEESIEEFPLINNGTGSIFTGNIIAPAEAIEELHRMRIRMTYNVPPLPYCNSDYGEVEDYSLFVGEFIPPDILWNPISFSQFVEIGQIARDSLTIKNIGEGPLLWNIEVSVPWLIVEPIGSIVESNDSIELILSFNAGYLQAGSYLANLILTTNDSTNLEIILPVEMFVGFKTVTQTYELEEGFRFISSNAIPPDPEMIVVMDDILNENLAFIRNSQGQILRKIGGVWVNGIGDWVIEEGYLIKMFNEDTFSIEGLIVNPNNPISLETGYQFISYFPENLMDALVAFEAIIGDDLDFIRNSSGQMIRKIGSVWINGIGECNPGEGYLVKMYSDDVLIYPSTSFTCGSPFIDPRDGQIYNSVQISGKCWMAENLNIGTMINGAEEMTNNSIIEKYCYDNDLANCDEYGGLYQWNEIMQYTITQGEQGICPVGWYIPTDSELKILEGNVDSQYPVGDPIWHTFGWRGFDVGLNLKSTSSWYLNGNGLDSFGFRILPGGSRNYDGNFNNIGVITFLWSSTKRHSNDAYHRHLSYNHNEINRGYIERMNGNSVRCLMDDSKFINLSNIEKNEDKKNTKIEMFHFSFISGNPADPVFTIYVDGLEIGDEIAAFDEDILVGAIKINSQNKFDNELPVFSTLNYGKGYISGNPIILKIWNKSENKEYILKDYTFSNPYGDAWIENVFPSEDGEYSLLHFSTIGISDENVKNEISIYPNPSDGIFNISIEGVEEKVQIKVFDIHGTYNRLFEIEETKGITTKQLDLIGLAAGVYFISISEENFNQVKKIVIQ